MAKVIETYKGFSVELDERSYRFTPIIPDEDPRAVASLAEAHNAIDEVLKMRASTLRIALRVIQANGEERTITGISRSDRRVIGPSRDSGANVYPAGIPWIEAELDRLAEAKAAVTASEARLRLVQISTSRGYGNLTPTDYPDLVASLERAYGSALAKAIDIQEGSGDGV